MLRPQLQLLKVIVILGEQKAVPSNSKNVQESVEVEMPKDEQKQSLEEDAGEIKAPKIKQEVENRTKNLEKRRRKLEAARRQIQSEDNEEAIEILSSVTGSQASSLDGVWAALKSGGHLSETDESTNSNSFSLGKIGRLLGEHDNVSSRSSTDKLEFLTKLVGESCVSVNITPPLEEQDTSFAEISSRTILQEPDLVASTKSGDSNSAISQSLMQPPVAPPRRKRKNKVPSQVKPSSLEFQLSSQVANSIRLGYDAIPSPTTTIDIITKEFEHSLDLPSAVRGQYVVKPQDEETTKAQGPSLAEQQRIAALIGDALNAGNREAIESGLTKQLNMLVRTRTDSGKQLTDLEILEQVMVLNLDTGEAVPLSLAEDRIPQCVNPLSLHIMRLTSEYVSNSSLEKGKESDEDLDETRSKASTLSIASGDLSVKKKTTQIKQLINRTVEKTVSKIKSVADEVYHSRHPDDMADPSEDELAGDPKQAIKFKSSGSNKGPYEFNDLKLVQDLSGEHSGAVWTMKFSYCGRLLATVGQDHILRVWVLKDSFDYFNDMRQKYNAETRISPTPSQESLTSHHSTESSDKSGLQSEAESNDDTTKIFAPKPFCLYVGHTADLLDVSWSKNYFILSSSMDKTVRLWHISRKECLCCFQHIDFVTAIAFHPRDDRYFLSGSLDGKLRLWNIPDKKVALWNELDGQTKLITAANFCQNGKFAVVGTYDGRCVFYTTEQLKYYTQIHVRSTRGKNAKGRKISGIEPTPGEDKILVTSNDSRIRLYDLRDLSLTCKYKGYVNLSSQIRASFSHDGKYIVSGSENQYVYLWKTAHDYAKFSSARKDRNDYWERIKAHNAVVTAALFAPNPQAIFAQMAQQQLNTQGNRSDILPEVSTSESAETDRYVLVTADFAGGIKVFSSRCRAAAKHS
ncbi:hypothetical protein CHUAL_003240 [Chamberlinius hualienensis]